MNFSRDEDSRLIELVAVQRLLYDASHKDYKNAVLRDNIWRDIASQLENKTGDDCKKRWRSIRDTWKRLKRDNKLGTGSAARSKRTWPLFPYLEFLNSVQSERCTVGNILPEDVPETEDTQGQQTEIAVTGSSSAEVTVEYIPEAEEEGETIESVSSIDGRSTPGTSRVSQGSRRNRQSTQRDQIYRLLEQSKEERDRLIETLNRNDRQDDELDLFYKSLAISVKRLPRHLQSQAKLQHLQTVTELEMQAANDSMHVNEVVIFPSQINGT